MNNKFFMDFFNKKEIIPIGLILIAFLIGFMLYPDLPERIPSHWNAQGEVDGWMNKDFAVIFIPGIALLIYLLMVFLPRIDPLRSNYPQFSSVYFGLRTALVVFLVGVYIFTLATGLGYTLNINYFMLPAMSLLFILIGLFLPRIKKNYFVGIRTPWTIHSEKVWDKTHQFAGKLFIAAGIIILAGILVPQYTFWFIIIPALGAALGSVAYSYIVFTRSESFKK